MHVLLYLNAKRKFAQLENQEESSIRPGLDTAMSMVSSIVFYIMMMTMTMIIVTMIVELVVALSRRN